MSGTQEDCSFGNAFPAWPWTHEHANTPLHVDVHTQKHVYFKIETGWVDQTGLRWFWMSGLFLLVAKHNCETHKFSSADGCEFGPNVKCYRITPAVRLGFVSLFIQLISPEDHIMQNIIW